MAETMTRKRVERKERERKKLESEWRWNPLETNYRLTFTSFAHFGG
jgi:hypothetical protein